MTDRKNWKLGLSIGRCTEETLNRAANCGIDVVEISGVGGEEYFDQWKNIPKWSADSGVEVRSLHLPFRAQDPVANLIDPDPAHWKSTVETYKRYMEGAANGALKIVVTHPSCSLFSDEDRPAVLELGIRNIGYMTDLARSFGLTLAVENMPRTLCRTSDEARKMLDAVPDLKFCFDTNHLYSQDHASYLHDVADRLITTHISDYDLKAEQHWLPLQGQINWRNLMTVYEEIGYDGPFLYETGRAFSQGRTWEEVRPNFEYLLSLSDVK